MAVPYKTFTAVHSLKKHGGDDVVEVVLLKDGGVLAILADGASGSGKGITAAKAFAEICIERILNSDLTDIFLKRIFEEADNYIATSCPFCDTTGIVVIVQNGQFICASVGDSEVRMLSEDEGERLITHGQPRKPRIGSFSQSPLIRRGDMTGPIVLASDGLGISISWEDTWELIVTNTGNPAASVVEEVVKKYGNRLQDDLSLVVITRSTD